MQSFGDESLAFHRRARRREDENSDGTRKSLAFNRRAMEEYSAKVSVALANTFRDLGMAHFAR